MIAQKQVSGLWHTIQAWLHPIETIPETDWPMLARSQTRCAFVVWLADEVAHDLLANKSRHVSIEELCQSVWECRSSGIQQRAEHFLKNFYYTYPSIDPRFFRVLRIFRHLIQKKLKITNFTD